MGSCFDAASSANAPQILCFSLATCNTASSNTPSFLPNSYKWLTRAFCLLHLPLLSDLSIQAAQHLQWAPHRLKYQFVTPIAASAPRWLYTRELLKFLLTDVWQPKALFRGQWIWYDNPILKPVESWHFDAIPRSHDLPTATACMC